MTRPRQVLDCVFERWVQPCADTLVQGQASVTWSVRHIAQIYLHFVTRCQNLIKTGAQEAKLPLEYLDFIDSIPVYHPSTNSFRKTGAMIFVAVWGPVMILLERLVRATVQSNGYAPRSVISLVRLTMKIIWLAHDLVFAPIFGRGDGLDDA